MHLGDHCPIAALGIAAGGQKHALAYGMARRRTRLAKACLEHTLTVLTLKLSPRLRRSLATTNAAESLLSRTRDVKRNVQRWRSGQMMLRWVAVVSLEAP